MNSSQKTFTLQLRNPEMKLYYVYVLIVVIPKRISVRIISNEFWHLAVCSLIIRDWWSHTSADHESMAASKIFLVWTPNLPMPPQDMHAKDTATSWYDNLMKAARRSWRLRKLGVDTTPSLPPSRRPQTILEFPFPTSLCKISPWYSAAKSLVGSCWLF